VSRDAAAVRLLVASNVLIVSSYASPAGRWSAAGPLFDNRSIDCSIMCRALVACSAGPLRCGRAEHGPV